MVVVDFLFLYFFKEFIKKYLLKVLLSKNESGRLSMCFLRNEFLFISIGLQVLNKCSDGVDCTEEQHQINRRSEFIITAL